MFIVMSICRWEQVRMATFSESPGAKLTMTKGVRDAMNVARRDGMAVAWTRDCD
jgi:hypothetical protein